MINKAKYNCLEELKKPGAPIVIVAVTQEIEAIINSCNENGIKVARFLRLHKKALNVTYPGLPNHKQKDIALKQMNGFGGMITFIYDGNMSEISKFMRKLRIFTIAESLGGVESLIESPALMTHAYLDNKSFNHVPKKLVRLSVGIEDSDDLIEDLNQAFK